MLVTSSDTIVRMNLLDHLPGHLSDHLQITFQITSQITFSYYQVDLGYFDLVGVHSTNSPKALIIFRIWPKLSL